MKNPQKGFIVPALLAIIVLFVIGGAIYINVKKKSEAPTVVYDNKEQAKDSFLPADISTKVILPEKENSENGDNSINTEKEESKTVFSLCLPADRKLDDVVKAEVTNYSPGGIFEINKTTIEQKLTEMNASCSNSKLFDSSGKEIVFYDLDGCWGAQPPNEKEIMLKQQEKINKLKEEYTVIEMTCNTSGVPFP